MKYSLIKTKRKQFWRIISADRGYVTRFEAKNFTEAKTKLLKYLTTIEGDSKKEALERIKYEFTIEAIWATTTQSLDQL